MRSIRNVHGIKRACALILDHWEMRSIRNRARFERKRPVF